MLVFIDESGDSGMQSRIGSSAFFTVALVIFEDREEAEHCDQRIELLKKELNWEPDSEFHFTKNSDRVRRIFLQAVVPYNFFYYSFVLNKNPAKLTGEGFQNKSSFYKYACGLVFENAKEKLINSTVVVDESGSLDFKRQLTKYLRNRINDGRHKCIRKIKMQKSEKNNLLQLADYVAGVINRSVQNKKHSQEYRKIISPREIRVQIWPPIYTPSL